MLSSLIAVVTAVALASFSSKMAQAQCPCYGGSHSMACEDPSLTSIPDCVPSNISDLYIWTPSIPLVPDTIRRFTNLDGIFVGYFDTPQLSKSFLSAQPNISEFGIYSTILDYVDSEWFLYTPGIKYLSLGYNKIASLDSETFSSLPQLITLYLDNNQLTSLQQTVFQGTDLKVLYLKGNPWQCDCELANFMQWVRDSGLIIPDQPTCSHPSELEGLELTQLTPDAVCKN